MERLPVDAILEDVRAALRRGPCLVLEAPPGAGKTTRVPAALLDVLPGQILVLEPRRLAARLAAERVARERGERPGETVGWQVRFQRVAGARTRLLYLTEGLLARRLLVDPGLEGVSAVVLDEFHERHLEGDLALALLRRLQLAARPDLRLLVMSATLDGAAVAQFLGGCPLLRSEGRLHPLEVRYTPHSAQRLEELVQEAVEACWTETEGDILVFLPGAAEIRRAMERLLARRIAHEADILPLHGDLPPEQQDRAVQPGPRRRVVLSTNLAESSVTIPGVRAVVDSGLARIPSDSPWSGLPRLEVRRISRASATQRAGRAARLGPGLALRLYPQEDFLRRPEHDTPEILRRELSQLCLHLHAAGVRDPLALEWMTPPPPEAVAAAEELLRRLGALDANGRLTEFGARLSRLPLHPRLAALVERGGAPACRLAAELSAAHPAQAEAIENQLRTLAPPRPAAPFEECVLRAFPDRVARRRRGRELQLSNGSSALLADEAGLGKAEFLVALETEERPERGLPVVRRAVPIEPELLLDVFPERLREARALEWNREAGRVEEVWRLSYDGLVIEESRSHAPDPEQAAELLAQKALEAGLERFADGEALEELRQRIRFAGLPEPDVEAALRALCRGLRSFDELRRAASGGGLEAALKSALGPQAAELERLAPGYLRLPSGRRARIRYPAGAPPFVAARLQDFFGMRETPRIGPQQTPLVVHLLAPNQRPVQVTQDLAGFWQRLYPQVRRELMRRYPKHSWPEL
ncbi:MAG: helicase-related protein [Bryobacteraceae bacterium]|nr:helicase-related protein [Bryobacteraceae bacterium]